MSKLPHQTSEIRWQKKHPSKSSSSEGKLSGCHHLPSEVKGPMDCCMPSYHVRETTFGILITLLFPDFWFRSGIKGEFSQPWSLRRPSNSSSVRKFIMIVVKRTYIYHFEFSYLNVVRKPRKIYESSKWEQWNLYNVDKCHKAPSCGLLSCWAYSRQVRSDQSLLVKNLKNSATHGRPKEAPNP